MNKVEIVSMNKVELASMNKFEPLASYHEQGWANHEQGIEPVSINNIELTSMNKLGWAGQHEQGWNKRSALRRQSRDTNWNIKS